jgi:hypothetical protein
MPQNFEPHKVYPSLQGAWWTCPESAQFHYLQINEHRCSQCQAELDLSLLEVDPPLPPVKRQARDLLVGR